MNADDRPPAAPPVPERRPRGLDEVRAREPGGRWSRVQEALTVAVINYNGREVLPRTLEALRRAEPAPRAVLLLDDASTDGSPEWVERHYPEVRVLRSKRHHAKPSRLRNRALRLTDTRYVLLLDNDVAVEPACLGRLMRGIRERPRLLACSPCLVHARNPNRIYYLGNELHYLCIATNSLRGSPLADRAAEDPFPTIPGGNALLDREVLQEVGGFDEGYDFGWGEDAELFVRGKVRGLESVVVPDAIARHVERPRGFARAEAQLYNRYRLMLTVYGGRTLLLLSPALLCFEILLLGMCVVTGLGRSYARSVARLLRSREEIRDVRGRVQASRRASDSAVLTGAAFDPAGALASSRFVRGGTRLASGLFGLYWALVRRWI